MNHNALYINGKWVAPIKGQSFDTINPADETLIGKVAAASKEDIELAVKAARNAFDNGDWAKTTGAQRAGFLRKIADGIRGERQMLAELEVQDNGKPLTEALADIDDSAGCFDFYADLAEKLDSQQEYPVTVGDDRFNTLIRKEPIGVAGAIIPWNYPLLMVAWKVAPALAAGCTMVLKPSELTPLTALKLAEIADSAALPAGVLNVLTGLGVPTGSRIMAAAARDIKNISLELGGKSPFIVFADSDIEQAAEWVMFGIFFNQGQVCSATSRVLVERPLYEKLLARIAEQAAKITIGDGMQDDVQLGPIVNKSQYEKVLAAIEKGKTQGARLVCGGKRPAGLDKGYFVEPTVFADVPEDSFIWNEEIFGPVVAIRPFDTEVEAVQSANNSRFGLGAAVMSKDNERCERVARALRAGIVWINCSQPTFTEAPWGGYKQSGIGRELGEWGLNNYLETKQITRYNTDEPWGWYIK